MNTSLKRILINKINKSQWWHATPYDPSAYKKRGKFLASTYQKADFYGRPNDIPEKVSISNPIYGTSEIGILKCLFPQEFKKLYSEVLREENGWYNRRIRLDSKMYKRAKKLGYDAIVLLAHNGIKYLKRNRKPHSIELNLLYPSNV
jgi:hypothetical protein